MKTLKTPFYVLTLSLLSCKAQQVQSSPAPNTQIEQNITQTGFTTYILKFYKGEANDSVSIFKKQEHIESTYKKRTQNIDYQEYTLTCTFYRRNKKVDSIQFQNPLYQRYEIFEGNAFKSGILIQDSSSSIVRTSSLSIDSLIITSKDNRKIVLYD